MNRGMLFPKKARNAIAMKKRRHGCLDIRQHHDEEIDDAAQPPGRKAHERAADSTDQGAQHGDEDGGAQGIDDAAQDIPPQMVCAKHMIPAAAHENRWPKAGEQVLGRVMGRRHEIGEDGNKDDQRQPGKADDDRDRHAAKQAPAGKRSGIHDSHWAPPSVRARLTLGSMTAWRMSTRRLDSTMISVTVRMTP